MPAKLLDEEGLFHAARRIADPAARALFIDQACGDNAALAVRVRTLLEMHDRESDSAEPSLNPTISFEPIAERPGSRIGPYVLREQIGEGGFGLVFVAEQQEPVKRKVALKIIKPGMDSRQVIARFEAERQALALMDHPNIAKVLDAGATESGRPYFIMELVRGIPITEYCDKNQLPPKERLELFISVCHAIQHAHQKGVIHRDIKPSNVLVTSHDGKPVAKVIDFGVAKAIHQQLSAHSIYTNFAQMIGTPLYMSPEQAEMSGLDIDTRSDIYSLGVLLYELLTGTTPLEKKRFAQAAYDEIRRLIREEEPPRPSTRLSSSDSLASIAAQRRSEPAKLSRLVRGDLDWITMKALEKDRTRRYETANGLAMDVQRHLDGEPVLAVPPSTSYRLRKFARKNRAMLTTAATVAALLLAGMGGTTFGMIRASRSAEAERVAKVEAEEQKQKAEEEKAKAVQSAQREADERKKAQASEAQTKAVLKFVEDKVFAAGRPVGQDGGLGHEVSLRKAIDGALPDVAAAFKDQPLTEASLRMTLGTSYMVLGESQAAMEQYEQARRLCTQHLGPDHPDTLSTMNNLASSYAALGRHAEALKLREETLDIMRRVLPKDHPHTLASMHNLAVSYAALGRHAEALKLREEALDIRRRVLPKDHPDTLVSMNNLANSYSSLGRHAEALKLCEETLDIQRRVLPRDHPHTLTSMHNLASSYSDLGRQAEALKLYEETLAARRRVLPRDHPDTLSSMMNLATSYVEANRHAEALKLVEELLPKADLPGVARSLYSMAITTRIQCCQKAGDLSGCRSTAELLEKRNPSDALSLYNAACCRAITAAVQAKAPGPDSAKLAQEDADKAMAWLKKAVAAGWKNAPHIRKDSDLDSLRDRADFRKLLAELEATSAPPAESGPLPGEKK